jgi:hypothetical protein
MSSGLGWSSWTTRDHPLPGLRPAARTTTMTSPRRSKSRSLGPETATIPGKAADLSLTPWIDKNWLMSKSLS